MKWLWWIFGFYIFKLPRSARLVQRSTLCDQTAIAMGIENSTTEESWCPMSRFTFIVMDSEFEGQYGSMVVSEVSRFSARLFRPASVQIKIAATEISQSAIMSLIHEAQRD